MKPVLCLWLANAAAVVVAAIVVACSGCAITTPSVPVTPANQAQIAACESAGNAHNDFVIGDYVVGGLGGAAGVVGAALPASDNGAKVGLAVGAVGATAIVALGTTLAEVYGASYAANNCPQVMFPALSSQPKSAALPSYEPAPRFDPNRPDWASGVRTSGVTQPAEISALLRSRQ